MAKVSDNNNDNGSMKTYSWTVGMTCNGCVGQIDKILTRVNDKADNKFTWKIDLNDKTVKVQTKSASNANNVSVKIKKWADLKDKSYQFNGEI